MRNSYKLFILVILFGYIFVPNKVYAFDETYKGHEGCTYTDMANLKEKVKEARISYDYNVENLMTITIVNIEQDFYIEDEYGSIFKYDSIRETPQIASIDGYLDGQILDFTYVASKTSVCDGETILVTSIKLPRYNVHFGNKICNGVDPDKFSLCSKWYPTEISEAAFISKVTAYKAEIKKANEAAKEVKTEKTIIDSILDNYYYILIGILIITVIVIVILTIRNKKRRVL